MWIAARTSSTTTRRVRRRVPRGARERRGGPMTDQDYTRDENPHQGPSHTFGKNVGTAKDANATSRSAATETASSPTTTGGSTRTTSRTATDRERSIAQGRESPRTNVSRPAATAPVRTGNTGYGPFTLMRRLSDDMDRLFENFGFGRGAGLGAAPFWGTDRDLA